MTSFGTEASNSSTLSQSSAVGSAFTQDTRSAKPQLAQGKLFCPSSTWILNFPSSFCFVLMIYEQYVSLVLGSLNFVFKTELLLLYLKLINSVYSCLYRLSAGVTGVCQRNFTNLEIFFFLVTLLQ